MGEKSPVIEYEEPVPDRNVVRGSARRALKVMGSVVAVPAALLALVLWRSAKEPTVTKVAVEIAFIAFGAIITLGCAIASTLTVARVRDGGLNFSFCGIQRRSIPIGSDTAFQLHKIGRLQVLVIHSGDSSYVPNGMLNRQELLALLRANGVTERTSA